jgi:hypothetical protein
MKKQYISPITFVISVTIQSNILAGSPGIDASEGPASGSSTVLSRQGGSFWDDDDE